MVPPASTVGAVEMGLNIKNEGTCRLAGELARRERLEHETKRRGVEARLNAMRGSAERWGGESPLGNTADLLYDERGLPK